MPTDTTNLDATFHTPGTNRLLADLAAVRPEAVIEQSDEDATAADLEGLRMVVAAVSKATPGKFSLGLWGFMTECGFAGCAVGWFIHFNPADSLKFLCDGPSLERGDMWFGGWEAVKERFGLDSEQVEYLFDEDAYGAPSREDVIARIEQFIRDHTPATVPSDDDAGDALGVSERPDRFEQL